MHTRGSVRVSDYCTDIDMSSSDDDFQSPVKRFKPDKDEEPPNAVGLLVLSGGLISQPSHEQA